MAKYLGETGLVYLWSKIKAWVGNYTKITTSNGVNTLTVGNTSTTILEKITSTDKLSADLIQDGTNNKAYTATEKTKLSGIESGAEVNQNAFSNVKVGSTTILADGKTDTLELTAGSNGLVTLTPDATNDKITIEIVKDLSLYNNSTSQFITLNDVPPGAAASNTTPKMDASTAVVGTETAFARGDHLHPTDTTRLAVISDLETIRSGAALGATAVQTETDPTVPNWAKVFPIITGDSASNVNNLLFSAPFKGTMGTGSGDAGRYHIGLYTTDGSTPLPADNTPITGIISLSDPGGAWGHAGDSAIPTIGLVYSKVEAVSGSIPTATTTSPKMDGTAAVGSETKWAKGDHVHPTDTTRAPLASPTFTGTPKAPTAAASTNNTQIATTAFVKTAVGAVTVSSLGAIPTSQKGAANGVCPLDANTKIDAAYLPSYVDDVVEAYIRSGQTALGSTWLATGSASGTAITPQAGVIYVLMNSDSTYTENTQFRWGGTSYVKLNDGGISELSTSEMDTATNNWT